MELGKRGALIRHARAKCPILPQHIACLKLGILSEGVADLHNTDRCQFALVVRKILTPVLLGLLGCFLCLCSYPDPSFAPTLRATLCSCSLLVLRDLKLAALLL